MNDNDPAPQDDPTKTPKAPKVEGENMPPAGGESMSPDGSRRPFAAPGGASGPDVQDGGDRGTG